jgi:hypothetical protein
MNNGGWIDNAGRELAGFETRTAIGLQRIPDKKRASLRRPTLGWGSD